MTPGNRNPQEPVQEDMTTVLRDAFNEDIPEELEARMQGVLKGFREDLHSHAYIRALEKRRARARSRQWYSLTPGRVGTIAGAALVLVLFGLFTLAHKTPTWAAVVERFKSVASFSATVYIKEDALGQPQQFELWMGRAGRLRLRVGEQVIFGRDGKVTRAFDVKSRREVEPERMAAELVQIFGASKDFSLESIISNLGGSLADTTPVVNPDAVISQDLVVFDVQSDRTPEWIRIWALRESRLPLHVRLWDPRDGDSADVFFSYARPQPDKFFDADTFAKRLAREPRGAANLAYAFLTDPGDHPISPQDLFDASGYHTPVVEDVGVTEDGMVWVVAGKSANRGPNGQFFWGFSKAEDDLNREYVAVHGPHWTLEDRSVDIFVPLDYPFDKRVPSALTFVCEEPEYHPDKTPTVIGSYETTTWKRGEKWPGRLVHEEDLHPLITLAHHFLRKEDWVRLERLLTAIPGSPEDDPCALRREGWRLTMLVKQGEYDEAVTLGERLKPLLLESVRKPDGLSPRSLHRYVVALAAKGRLEDARKVCRQTEDNMHSRLKEHYDSELRVLVGDLNWQAKLQLADVSHIVGVDVRVDKRFRDIPLQD